MDGRKTARLIKLYEDDLHVRFSARSVPSYLCYLHAFLRWLGGRGLSLADVRTDDLAAYQGDLFARRKENGRTYAAGSQAAHIVVVKSLFRFLYRRGYLLADPAAAIEYPRLDKVLPRVILTAKEAARVIEAARGRTPTGRRDRAILETLYATGIRCGELTRLSLFDIDTEARILKVVRGKGHKDRNLPLTRAAAVAIERYLVHGRPALVRGKSSLLFLASRGGRMDGAVVNHMVRQYAKAAALKKRVTCHTFRHSMATHLLRGRADIRHIQALLGHSKLSTTEIYTRVEVSDLRAVVRRAHPRGR